ncbi:hypothetical protein [Sinisalibacter aestuarii]|uniref:Biopolymer transporter ExbD n=1 Tax=Sinisalibacter aestuarii TaxID=2949426 RepID=A0ABQ5LVA7_9RHOB|nr:hypothetical protein [Sinisalibacter aestuarii]GKY88281.1 hypothetical protein STA1M1_21500 [Sinisalibacter aestuarii]
MFDELRDGEFDAFTDLLFNALVGFAFMFFIAFAMINPVAETGKIDTDVEILITMRWPDGHEDDVDVYVEDPVGNIVWYNDRETGLMHLDRDDRGQFKDVLLINGEEIENPLNQETVSVRGLMNGEYVVNVVHFIATSVDPLPVTVKVEKMNPSVRVIYYGEVELTGTGDEVTVARFTLQDDEIRDVNNRQKSLVEATRRTGPAGPGGDQDAATGEVVAQ